MFPFESSPAPPVARAAATSGRPVDFSLIQFPPFGNRAFPRRHCVNAGQLANAVYRHQLLALIGVEASLLHINLLGFFLLPQ